MYVFWVLNVFNNVCGKGVVRLYIDYLLFIVKFRFLVVWVIWIVKYGLVCVRSW